MTPSRKRVETEHASARRPRRYRPHCKPLEDRCLLSVTLADSGPPVPLVGSPVTWTATASGHGTTPVYQFSVGPVGGPSRVFRDFSTSNSFAWDPLQEGNYQIRVTVKNDFSATSGESAESASATYMAQSRVVGAGAVISPTSNPLVALYSVPPSAGSSVYVQFSPAGPSPSWTSTAPMPIVPGASTNFLVAGLRPTTTYLVRHVLSDGTASAPLAFTTGALPTNLKFATVTVPQAPGLGNDPTQNAVFNFGLLSSPGSVDIFATDLSGNIEWYYPDPKPGVFASEAVSLVPGGSVLMLASVTDTQTDASALREINLAGDSLRETNVAAVNAELAALGRHSITDFNHDAQRLPNGDTAVIAHTKRVVNLNGVPTNYLGDMVVVLDQDFQVAWAWDAFDWLDTNRLPPLGEGPGDWLHANSVAFSPTDGNLIVSVRSQDWVIKINYSNGTGDGHVVWRLGAGGDFAINSSDPSPWFSHQHDSRYVNDSTLVIFDDGNTRRATNPNANSRGQELILNEQTKQATLVVNADLGNYSLAVGSAERLPNGNFVFTSGFQGSFPNNFGQTIEVLPNGTKTYVQQITGAEYRSYLMSSLYGPATDLYDPGFEDPSQGSAWSFGGMAGESGDPKAPQGSQVAFLQQAGTISQAVDFYAAGSYVIGVSAAQRAGNGTSDETVQVLVDGKVVDTFTPAGVSYAAYTTPPLNLTAGGHTIGFVGVDPNAADAALLDNVSIADAPPSNPSVSGAVDLSSAFNRTGIVADGTAFSAGFDGVSYALSANLLGTSVQAGGQTFRLGAAGSNDVVAAVGQTIALPAARDAALNLLGAGSFGDQPGLTFTVHYTDGTSQAFTQGLSDWWFPANNPGEAVAVVLPYIDTSSGGRINQAVDLYRYTFTLDPSKTVQSLTLPGDSNVSILAATLTPASSPTQVGLGAWFNRTGIAADGKPFAGGLDGTGYALSGDLLGTSLSAGGVSFSLGAGGTSNAVSAAGQSISLPAGSYHDLSFLGAGVYGNQANQVFTVHYTDGTSQAFTQSLSDWWFLANNPGEAVAAMMPYLDTTSGAPLNQTVHVYQYTFALDPTKSVASITLPSNSQVEILAISLLS